MPGARLLQSKLQALAGRLVEERKELGLQIAAYVDGDLAADVAMGFADPERTRPVTPETLFPVFSVTKAVTATLVHILVDRGVLRYDTPICELWPEFAAHGKGGITVRHALAHTAGLPHMPEGMGAAELCDWNAICAAIADLTPLAEPGEETIYHAMTFGWILGETMRRADGRTFPQRLREDLAEPLSANGLFVGLPAALEPRVAVLECEPSALTPMPRPGAFPPPAVPGSILPLHAWMNRPDVRRASIPATNGIMNARSIARHFATLLPGGAAGVELFSAGRLREAIERPQHGAGPALGSQVRGLGYELGGSGTAMGGGNGVFGHSGYGGSIGFASIEGRYSFAFTRNRFSAERTPEEAIAEFRSLLGRA